MCEIITGYMGEEKDIRKLNEIVLVRARNLLCMAIVFQEDCDKKGFITSLKPPLSAFKDCVADFDEFLFGISKIS